MNSRAALASVAHSASTNRVFCWSYSGLPKTVRSLVYASVNRTAFSVWTTALTARISRSWGIWFISAGKPAPSAPMRFATGTRHPWKNNSDVSAACWPILRSGGPR